MQPTASHIARLYYRLQTQQLNAEEQEEWDNFCADYPKEAAHLQAMGNETHLVNDFDRYSPAAMEQFSEMLLKKIKSKLSFEQPLYQKQIHRVHLLRTAWFRYAAAIIIITGIGAYLWNTQQKEKSLITHQPVPVKDILAGGNKALLRLADGSIIELDSAANGQLAVEKGSSVIKKDGQIIYDLNQRGATVVAYNTMSTQRGGTYQLTLPDGTRVWLNAASSITFPTAFIEKERVVKITGEAYFEVAKNKVKPFIVKTSKEDITVLGTSFNINAYSEEQNNKTSLLEGSVKISNAILKPGQAYRNGKIIKTNIEQDIAWKNGFFNFEDVSLDQAMKQFARWYDVEIIYDNKMPQEQLSGGMDRNLSLQNALKGLEGVVAHFRLEGRTVHVQPL